MMIKYRNGGRIASVSSEEGRALISSGLADEVFVNPPTKRENALEKKKKEKRGT